MKMTDNAPDPALKEESPDTQRTTLRSRRFWMWCWLLLAIGVFGSVTWIVAPILYEIVRQREQAAEWVTGAEIRLATLEDGVGATRKEQARLLDAVTDLDVFAVRLESRIAAIARSLEALKADVDGPKAADMERRISVLEQERALGAHLSDPINELGDLARRVLELEQAVIVISDAPISERFAAVQQRVAGLERVVAELGASEAGARGALVIAAAQLQARIATAKNFSRELEAALALATGKGVDDSILAATLSELRPLSDGVPTVVELAQDFEVLAGNLVAAEVSVGAAGDSVWLAELWRRVRGVVKVRRTGDLDGHDAEARVARAEERLEEGNLGAAVEELVGLQGVASGLAMSWLSHARDRITLDAASDLIGRRAIVVITTVSETQP